MIVHTFLLHLIMKNTWFFFSTKYTSVMFSLCVLCNALILFNQANLSHLKEICVGLSMSSEKKDKDLDMRVLQGSCYLATQCAMFI